MNALAIDTVTPALSVTASGPRGTVTLTLKNGGPHAPALVELIDEATRKAGFKARDTDFVAVPEGPGSFTGLRLAWAAAKAISLAAGCRLVPIPTLDAYALRFKDWQGPVVSVLDAKKSRFYARVYRRGDPVTDPLDISAGELSGFVDADDRVLVTGPDATLFAEEFCAAQPLVSCTTVTYGESGASDDLLFLARTDFEGYTESIADHAGPLYVRRSDAEIESRKKGD